MKIAYLVSIYKNPRLVKRTLEFLACDEATFFVHVDKKADIKQFDSLRREKVIFTDQRVAVYWAEYSFVEAQLVLLRQALAAPEHFDYFVLFGGSEFPLRSAKYIHHFFEQNRGGEFITSVKMPAPGKPISRVNTLRYPSTRPVLRFIFRALAKFGLGQRDYRKHLGKLDPYSGNTWWALSREACQYIVDFMDRDQCLGKFLRNTHVPDECIFHTILGNSPFQARVRRNLFFEEWRSPAAHPEMINAQHLDYFEAQGKVLANDLHGPGELLFARKFSDETYPLVERLEAIVRKKENLLSAS